MLFVEEGKDLGTRLLEKVVYFERERSMDSMRNFDLKRQQTDKLINRQTLRNQECRANLIVNMTLQR